MFPANLLKFNKEIPKGEPQFFVVNTVWKVSKQWVFSGIFPNSDWIRRDTDTSYLSVFSLNAGKHGVEKTLYLGTFDAMKVYVKVKPHRLFNRHIWQCCILGFTNHNYSKSGFHCWLIKAWESCSCMCCFEMCCCQISTKKDKYISNMFKRVPPKFVSNIKRI